MKRSSSITIVTALAASLIAPTAMAANQGPGDIDIFGGQSGRVPFPHTRHQERLTDCNICHDVFPQEQEAIKKLKERGELKPKKVMNAQCIACHKAEKRSGKPHGPLTCSACHVK